MPGNSTLQVVAHPAGEKPMHKATFMPPGSKAQQLSRGWPASSPKKVIIKSEKESILLCMIYNKEVIDYKTGYELTSTSV